ncbi:MAG TPA: hypothetical protein PLK76_03130 [bacterium]|nr:hypothetical protein [bacterium]
MKSDKKFFLLILISVILFSSGCTISLSGNSSDNSSGVFKSYDYGETWQNSNTAKLADKTTTLNNINIRKIVFDPFDHKKIYLATGSGVWYSEDAGANWKNVLADSLIYDLALDQQKSGIVYVSLGQQIYKTLDLGVNWQQLFLESRINVFVNTLATDPQNNLVIYFGSSMGEIYKTSDGGASWSLIYQHPKKDPLNKILINPQNNQIIYAGLAKEGILKTIDGGKNWFNLKENYATKKGADGKLLFTGSQNFYDLIFDLTQNDALLYSSSAGLLKSDDGGKNWQALKLLTPAKNLIINALAINPKDNSQIFYATNTVFYRSSDAGKTWIATSLPSNKVANVLQIDPQTPNVLYLGMTNKAKK